MHSLVFVSSNKNKFQEIQGKLLDSGIILRFQNMNIKEIQSDSLKEIAVEKSRVAYGEISQPVIVEDDGLFIDHLMGFPGQYSSYVNKTIGSMGILKLLKNIAVRSASFISTFVFYEGHYPRCFLGQTYGRISKKFTEGGWGFDGIFIPTGSDLTFAQLERQKRKDFFSHRSKALGKFINWYVRH
jgi:XTP/dITP diphosphohydrolase